MNWPETASTLARARAEEPIEFITHDGVLRGIFTPRAPESRNRGICIVFPGHPRFGVQRFAVLAARQLATEGYDALRFDFHGHGESSGATAVATRENPYGDDVCSAIEALRERGQRQFLLIGYCYDALSALSALGTHAEAIRGLLIAAPPVLERLPRARLSAQHTKPSGVLQRLWLRRANQPLEHAQPGSSPYDSNGSEECAQKMVECFAIGFERLRRSSAHALFLYGQNDPLYREFAVVEEQLISKLGREEKARITVEIAPDLTHAWDGQRLLERTLTWAREFHQARDHR